MKHCRESETFARALRPGTKLFIVETPSNPALALTDLAEVAILARASGVITLADNTFAYFVAEVARVHYPGLASHPRSGK